MGNTVGELRAQAAYEKSGIPVVIVTRDDELEKLLGDRELVIEEFYPDTCDAKGDRNKPSFKIKVSLK